MSPTVMEMVTAGRSQGRQVADPAQVAAAPPVAGGGSAYGLAALAREAAAVATAPQGTRNDALNRAAFCLGQLVASGHLDGQGVTDALTSAAAAAGLGEGEVAATLRSGGLAGATQPRVVEPTWEAEAAPPTTVITAGTQGAPVAPASAAPPTPEEVEAARQAWHAQQVDTQAEQIRISTEARDRVTLERQQAAYAFPPHLPTLADELALPDEDTEFLVDDLFPVDANVLLTAQFKTGKTTLEMNLARALADRTPFLDTQQVRNDEERHRVVFLNYEVSPGQMRRWFRASRMTHPENVSVLNVRGHSLPVLDGPGRTHLVRYLTEQQARVVVVDPYARAFVGNGTSENDNMEAGRFLDAWDQIKEEAGVRELVMVTHTGRDQPGAPRQTRARGATRVDDWADVRWMLTRDPDTDQRFLSATGRDVEWPEHQLVFDPSTKRLSAGHLDRHQARRSRLEDTVVRVVQASPGIGSKALQALVRQEVDEGVSQDAVLGAVSDARGHLRIYSVPGPRGGKTYHPNLT